LGTPPTTISTIGAYRNRSLRIDHLHGFQAGGGRYTRRATRNLNAKIGARDAWTADDLLANLGVLHVGRTVPDRAHNDVDRRSRVDDGRSSSSPLRRGRRDDDDAAQDSADDR
jgi:hypothetical protein